MTMPPILMDDIALIEGEKDKLAAVIRMHPMATDRWREHYRPAEEAAREKLAEAGAVFGVNGDTTSIRFRGLRASSTMGLVGALGNWATSARSKIGEAAR